ncbi:TPA: type I restriction enzyme HsdR N-terminal domain-containing protein [Enterobacter asburiae]|uniref:type I restriction endonuclease n=1 Tax=Enterobacter asburiae TaxID=61645 RepID=UPI0007B37F34|nr:type I restriction endonuclease [Enterobacter asburiae]KZR50041.1 restriction endonuclease [Enterobacter asburiae]MBL5927147.1 type I restriction enzyme HsdR N-terminal domain-containing protein [Enterobacter asburiae]MBL5958058.1 type I restriction enzyme HsdR N-terminal domain-containing protein [Enterobacter asburiae]MCM7689588.1 type I restriction enzyme HsdR N-terminal domain-containing protein [Enterobacter asburiae]HDC4492128.1 type I restriction enzyme HsdR N-terminal domain-contain
MEFTERLNALSNKIKQQVDVINTEEATKTAFVMPFIHNVLGYDVFDPSEVTPEFVCDVGTKKGEKIDYAIMKNNDVQILIECKKIGEPLNINHASQLFRYFHVTNARISILTNGQNYKFFTDLDAPNKMDEKPFLEVDLLDVDENIIPELKKLTKSSFDLESIINAAGELKYVSQIKKILHSQLNNPEDDFVKFFASRVYDGILTQKVRESFLNLTKKAASQYINDQVNERLKSAITGITPAIIETSNESSHIEEDEHKDESDVVTTLEELEGYHIVKAITRAVLEAPRITHRDTKSYFGVLVDDNNRKPLCRLHFNRTQKYIGLFDIEKNETRHPITTVDDIYSFADILKATAALYN